MRARILLIMVVLPGCSAMDRSAHPAAAMVAEGPGPSAPPLLMVDDPGTWRRSTLPVHATRVTVGDARELPASQVDMRVEVAGFRARVGIEFVFANPDDRIYEGTFQMRLADDASPFRLAFGQTVLEFSQPLGPPGPVGAPIEGSWGELREARIVPRRAASAAYSETVNPRQVRVVVDPALAEWAGAGVFNMRVFPISPRQFHRVAFAYDVDLVPAGPDLHLELPVPANVPQVRASVVAGESVRVSPAVAGTAVGGGAMQYRFDDLREPISLRVANLPVVMRWQDAVAGPLFAARVVPQLPEEAAATVQPRAIFAVDTSLSSNPVRYNVWLALLREVLNANRAQLHEFAVVFFNVEARWWQTRFMANTPENVAAVLGFANTLALAGATDLGAALDQVATPPWPAQGPWDVFLLSDGAATWGEDDVVAAARRFAAEDCKDGKCPARLVAYRTHGVGVDPRLLGQLVRETGGTLIAVENEASAARVATAHRRRAWQLADVKVDGGTDIVVAGRPHSVSSGQPLVIVGHGAPPADAKLSLALKQGGEARTVAVPLGAGVESPLAARVYGQVVVEQLEENLAETLVEAEVYAQHFTIPGESCSLLMLESEADYAKFGVGQPRADAPVMLQGPVRPVIERGAQQAAVVGTDPRPALLRTLQVDARMASLISEAPAELLRVPSVPLATKSSAWRDIPVVLRPQLEKQAIDEVLLRGHAVAVRSERGAADGLKVLSSLAEARPGDGPLLRGLAFSALAWELPGAAYHLLERVRELAPGEPVDDHLMAVALAQVGRPELALAHFEAALARSTQSISPVWIDYLRFLQSPGPVAHAPTAEYIKTRTAELRVNGPYKVPLVVTLHWSGDNADVDLHVFEPDGTSCHYGRPISANGALALDVSDDHGPESYQAGQSARGRFKIAAKLFSGTRHRASTRTQVLVSVYKDVGGANETVTRHAATIEAGRVPTPIAEVELP